MFKLITDSTFSKRWNKVAIHPLQSWEWGQVREKTGNEVLRVADFSEENELLKVFLCTLHKVGPYKIAQIAKSPFPDPSLIHFLASLPEFKNVIFLKLEPETFIEEAGIYHLPLLKKSWKEEGLQFVQSNSRIYARNTFLLDLNYNEDQLLQNMKSKTRYNIRLAQKKGVVVKDETENPLGFQIFFDLYQNTISRQNYLGHNKDYHQTVWESLKGKMARNLVAYYNQKPLAAYQLFFFKDTAYYLYGGTSTELKEVMAPNLLMWEAMLLAKRLDCHTFDLWGALPKNYSVNDPWAGFHRFKEGYGGIHKTYLPTIDVVFAPLLYRFFSILWPLRSKMLELKQLL